MYKPIFSNYLIFATKKTQSVHIYASHLRSTSFINPFFQIFCEVDVLTRHFLHVVLHHQFHQLLETCALRVPTQFALRLRRISEQVDYICRTVEIRFTVSSACLASSSSDIPTRRFLKQYLQ